MNIHELKVKIPPPRFQILLKTKNSLENFEDDDFFINKIKKPKFVIDNEVKTTIKKHLIDNK